MKTVLNNQIIIKCPEMKYEMLQVDYEYWLAQKFSYLSFSVSAFPICKFSNHLISKQNQIQLPGCPTSLSYF